MADDHIPLSDEEWASFAEALGMTSEGEPLPVVELAAVLRSAAAGRREYAETSSGTPQAMLIGEAEAFELAASLLEGTITPETLTSGTCPSWTWHTYPWMPEYRGGHGG